MLQEYSRTKLDIAVENTEPLIGAHIASVSILLLGHLYAY